MIYNLVQYLTVQLPSITFVADGFSPDSPINAITAIDHGGNVAHWYDREDVAIQILSRHKNVTKSKYDIGLVYEKLKNRFLLLLPSATVDEILYPAIQTYQISPVQRPGYIGGDDNNLEM